MTEDIEVKKEEWFEPEGELMVDVWEDGTSIVIEAPVAGVEKESLEIIVKNDILHIRGVRKRKEEEGEKSYLLTECYWGPFSKEIGLPEAIKQEGVEANIEDAILTIRLPKKEEQEGTRVRIQ